jgi:uncharacterized protein YdcH (DUF465 family)
MKTKTLNELEEMVYDFAILNHKIGRIETDGTSTQAKYDKLVEQRDNLRNEIASMFKSINNLYPNELGWGKGKDE